ncbi:MAG: amino acid ABC transporter ATP-binding protein [Labrys sp. (in: a-proteobacteria)]
MPLLALEGLSARYGAVDVLKEVDLAVQRGEVVALIGPSGSGKSSMLRSVIGLNPPVAGTVRLDGVAIDYARPASLKAARQRMAIVFQQYNLFQNMTALDNVTVAPVRVQKRAKAEVEAAAVAMLKKVGLGEKLRAYPDELSGGQQQRVAIARALVLNPDLLLLDEVTAALDPELVKEVLDTIRSLAGSGMTMLIVSHEMTFVRDVADRVVMLDHGRIVENGSPESFFASPATERARSFLRLIARD